MLMVDVNNVSVFYENECVLKNISFQLKPGEMMAMIGPNGSGKSTLLKTILGLKKYQTGYITIGGVPPQKAVKKFIGQIAYLPQYHDVNYQLPLTVYDVVSQGIKAGKSWIEILSSEEKNQIEEALVKVQLADKKDQIFSSLSGGQRQRALLALALSHKPQLLFLDEPTNALDFGSMDTIYHILSELRTNHNVGILVISHDISAIVSASDRVGLLMQEMRYLGTPQNLSEEIIHDVFGSHIKIVPNDSSCKFCKKTD